MIDVLDQLLVELLTKQVPPFLTAGQVSFHAPDKEWRQFVLGGTEVSVSIYLIELFQNLDLRSNERRPDPVASGVIRRAPNRLNCRYLISAWSPATVTPMTDPAIDEAVVLYDIARVLLDSSPLNAREIYAPGSLPAGFPDDMLGPPLPVSVVPAEPFPKLADFWMRMDTIWKPVVELVVTLPVAYAPRAPVPSVTTVFGEYGTVGQPGLEEVVVIGGVVRLSTSRQPVPGAWARLVELDRSVTANAEGQFVFSGIRRGSYTLEAGAPGHVNGSTPIEVPSVSGGYDVIVT